MGGGTPLTASTFIAGLVIGPIAIIVGLVCYWLRREIRDATVAYERKRLGDRTADSLSKWQTPFWVGVSAMGFVCIGVVMIVSGIVGLVRLS